MPKDTTPAPVGTIPFIKTTPGVTEWTPISEAIVDTVPVDAVYYVSSTGSDVNPGTLLLPFATIQKAVSEIGTTGYQNTATVRVVDAITITDEAVVDLASAGPGDQTYPITITSNTTTILGTSTVQLITSDGVTGLWTLTAVDPIFTAGDVGNQIRFTTGPLSTYQKDTGTAPTQVSCFISRYTSPTEVELAYSNTTLPVAGNTFQITSNVASITFLNTSTGEVATTINTNRLHFDRIDLLVSSPGPGTSTLDISGEVTLSGVKITSSSGTTSITTNALLTGWEKYAVGVTSASNNVNGCYLAAVAPLYLSKGGEVLNLTYSCLVGDASSSLDCGATGTGWILNKSTLLGDWDLSGESGTTITNSYIDYDGTGSYLVLSGNDVTVSETRLCNSNQYGVHSAGGSVTFTTVSFEDNSVQVAAIGAAASLLLETCSYSVGIQCTQLFALSDGAVASVQGSINTSVVVGGGSLNESPITLTNGSELYLTGNLTLGSAPSRGAYLEGYSKLQCGNLSLNCTANDCLTLDSGASVDCAALTLVSGNGTALYSESAELNCSSLTASTTNANCCYLNLGSSVNVAGAAQFTSLVSGTALQLQNKSELIIGTNLTCSGVATATSMQTSSTISCNNYTATSTALTGANTYVANYSTLNARGNATLTGAGQYGTELTYGGLLTANNLTITGVQGGMQVNNRGSARLSGINITATSYGINLSGSDLVCVNTLTVNGSTTADGIVQSLGSTLRAADVSITRCVTAHALEDSVAIVAATHQVSLSTTGITLISSQMDIGTSTTINVTGTTLTLLLGSRLNGTALNLTSTGVAGVCVLMNNISTIVGTTFVASSQGVCLSLNSASITLSSTANITSTGTGAISSSGATIQCRGTLTVSGANNSSMLGGELKSDTATFTTTAGSALNLTAVNMVCAGNVTITNVGVGQFDDCNVKIQGGLTANGMTISNSDVTCVGAANFSLITTYALTLSSSTLTCVSATFTAAGQTGLLITNSSLYTTGAGTITASNCNNGIVMTNSHINTSGITAALCTNIGLSLLNSSISSSGNMAANGCTSYGINASRSNIECANLNVTGCGRAIDLTSSSSLNCGAVSADNSTNTTISIGTDSAMNSGNITATSTAGVGAAQMILYYGRLTCANLDLTRTVLGTAGSYAMISTAGTAIINGTITFTNCYGALLADTGSNIRANTLNSNAVLAQHHIQLVASILQVSAGTLQGGGASVSGVLARNSSYLSLFGYTINTPGVCPGIIVTDSTAWIGTTSISNCTGPAISFQGSTGNLQTVTGTGNTTYGVDLLAASNVTANNTTTVTGTTGNVRLGGRGTKTWVQIAGGSGTDVSDYQAGANTRNVMICIV